MFSLIEFFVRRYVFAISVFLALFLFGVVAYIGLGVDLLPDIEVSVVAVTTAYPGAGSEEVTTQVSEPIESALATLSGVSLIRSTSREGLSVVVVEFSAGVDADKAAVDVSQRVNSVAGRLPRDATNPAVLRFDPGQAPVLSIAISAPGADIQDVQRFVNDNVRTTLQQLGGVADVAIDGEIEREFQVLFDPGLLNTFNLSPQRLSSAIDNFSVDIPLGSLTVNGERVLLAGRNVPSERGQLENILVDNERGLRVKDVAVVRESAVDVDIFSRLNGEPAVILDVFRQSGSNTVDVANTVRRSINSIEFPENYSFRIINDNSVFIAATVRDTQRELLSSIVIVGLIVLFFVGRLGSVFSVVVAIPITFAGAIIVANLMGFTINIITLLAITVAVGLVVDDSIVLAETIDRYREKGYSRRNAAIRGAGEVSVAVLAATLSLLAVFLPISFLPGILGQVFASFGLTLAATIAFSYLEAMFFLTVRMAYLPNPLPPDWREFIRSFGQIRHDPMWMLRSLKRPWFWLLALAVGALLFFRLGAVFTLGVLLLPLLLLLLRYVGRLLMNLLGALLYSVYKVIDWLTMRTRDAYVATLRGLLAVPWLILLVAVGLFSTLFIIAPGIGFDFLPATDQGRMNVSLSLPSGTSLDRTNELASRIEAYLLSRDDVAIVQATIGGSGSDVGNVANSGEARFRLELQPRAQRPLSVFELVEVFSDDLAARFTDVPEAELSVSVAADGGPPSSADYSLTLISNDLDLLRQRDEQARAIIERNPYLRNVSSNLDATVSERVFVLNTAQLSGTGLSPSEVYNNLRILNVGTEASRLRQGGEEFPIRVRANPSLIRSPEQLTSFAIFAPVLGRHIPISQLGRFELREAPRSITRSNQSFAVDIEADVTPDNPGVSQIRNSINAELREAGVVDERVSIGASGGLDLTSDLVLYTPIAFGLALLLNYLVIASQFNSFKFPLYLLLTIPLALVGAFWLLFLTGTSLDVYSVLALVILVGLVTKTAILLLDLVVNQNNDAKTPLKDLLIESARTRFRPIVMTTLTLVAVSLPLLLGLGEGSEFRYSIGIVIFGGVVSSALLTLFVVPCAFYYFERKNFDKDLEPQSQSDSDSLETRTPRLPQPSPSYGD